ncbi:hypothetical protein [Microbulbifer hydrolyticus]|uniref:Uncharacterized protein n=1 Tax=Microbulbifer hydrolyticus TaxID=48074 RepID=A0A6P1TFT1_9GAMM|nr:hypothetical protein [Microbulbifer hydrolyticus]MBB5211954.1 hypothetical protein [Microbulbifer hydrolyticus]QHQ39642.1 hypothetical protein GTQ55_12030 [Microbulbifer hydrolyticus]
MNKYIIALLMMLFFANVNAAIPREKEVPGVKENLSIPVPDGESFSNVRALWLQRVQEKCNFKEFKIIRYAERHEMYGDALSLNPATGKYEAPKFPASVSGVYQCLENS